MIFRKINNIAIGLLILIFLVNAEHAIAQWIPGGNVQSNFMRQLDAVRWVFDSDVAWQQEEYFLRLNNRFQSRLFLSQGLAQNIQDENTLRFRSGFAVAPRWMGLMQADSYRFTTTEIRQESVLAGLRFTPAEQLHLDIVGGGITDSRSGVTDQGFLGKIQLHSAQRSFRNVRFQPSLRVEYADISPRTQQNYGTELRADYQNDDIRIRSHAGAGTATRESYQPSSFFNRDVTDIIESIRSDTTFVELQTRFPLTDLVSGFVNFSGMNVVRTVESRRISEQGDDVLIFDSRANRNTIYLQGGMDYMFRRHQITAGAELRYQGRSSNLINTDGIPQNQLVQRSEQLLNSNFEQSRLELFSDSRWLLSPITSMDIRGRFAILRYDTPEINRDDRDEQSYFLQTMLNHAFSDFFSANIGLTGEATHLVYLFSERSLENNWRRSLRFRPGFHWQVSERLTIRQNFLVRANYTVQDFQLEGRPASDQSSREYAMSVFADYQMNDDWKLDARASRSELRIGRLLWDSFQEIPTDTLITWEGELKFARQTHKYSVSAGVRYFLKRDFLPRTSIQAETQINGQSQVLVQSGAGRQFTHQVGPVVELMIPFESGNRIYLNGWMQQQLVRRSLFMSYPDEFRADFQRAESRFQRRMFPNVELLVQLRI